MKKNNLSLKILFLIPILFFGVLLIGKIGSAAESFTLTTKYLPTEIETGGDIPTFLNSVYMWGISIVGILALFQLIIGGFQYMTSGAIDQKSSAKEKITDALIGLVLALSSFLILNIASPELTMFKDLELSKIEDLIAGAPGTQPTTPNTTECLIYVELQNYVDYDYDCVDVSGGGCASGEGYYNCLAPSSAPPCSITNPDSTSCACDMATNPTSPSCTLNYNIPTNYVAGKTYRIGGSNCPYNYHGEYYQQGNTIPTICELYLVE